jgi:hypothetical protein
MEHMAALAECLEITRPVVGGVMIEMGGGQRNLCCGEGSVLDRRRSAGNPGKRPALPVAPGCAFLIPPTAIAEVKDHAAVGSLASFATPLGASKPDERRELRPVDWIEPTVLRANRHRPYFLDAGRRASPDYFPPPSQAMRVAFRAARLSASRVQILVTARR